MFNFVESDHDTLRPDLWWPRFGSLSQLGLQEWFLPPRPIRKVSDPCRILRLQHNLAMGNPGIKWENHRSEWWITFPWLFQFWLRWLSNPPKKSWFCWKATRSWSQEITHFAWSSPQKRHEAPLVAFEEHTYLPILPNSFRWALESPAPFLMGVSGSPIASAELPEDVRRPGGWGMGAWRIVTVHWLNIIKLLIVHDDYHCHYIFKTHMTFIVGVTAGDLATIYPWWLIRVMVRSSSIIIPWEFLLDPI